MHMIDCMFRQAEEMACGGKRRYIEPQTMALFLKERCDNGLYGLHYHSENQTCICIPWPVVPKTNEIVHDVFNMFEEWAILASKKHSNAFKDKSEGLSQQKHRFRNALNRAAKLKYREELSVKNKIKVYQLTETCFTEEKHSMNEQFCGSKEDVDDHKKMCNSLDEMTITDKSEPMYVEPAQSSNPTDVMNIVIWHRGKQVFNKEFSTHSCRLYYGKNIPALREDIHSNKFLFGTPDMEPVLMPSCSSEGTKQRNRTETILENMNRGLVILLIHDYALQYPGTKDYIQIPDVYAVRLCQTKVYPFGCNVHKGKKLSEHGLIRQEPEPVFSAHAFKDQFERFQCGQSERPSATVWFTLGQKPLPNNRTVQDNLVTVAITMRSTENIIRWVEDSESIESNLMISDLNSMDKKARNITVNARSDTAGPEF